MNKICTSIEQSKKLIELGIDVNTADMFYSSWTILADGEYILSPLNGETLTNLQRQYGNQIIPAWSLSALLELIPKEQHPELVVNAHYKWICDISNPFSFAYKPTAGDNPLDAAFEMICWLKRERKI